MATKQVLVLDYDDHLVPFILPFRQWMLNHHGYDMGQPRNSAFALSEAYGDPPELSWDDYIDEFYFDHSLDLQPPFAGVVETLENLSGMYELHIMTSRPPQQRQVTEASIEKYFGDLISALHMPTKHGNDGLSTPKGDLCRSLNAIALSDDGDHNIRDVMEAGVQAILFKADHHYYNGHNVPEGTLVANDWKQLFELLKERYETGRWPVQDPRLPASSYYSIG